MRTEEDELMRTLRLLQAGAYVVVVSVALALQSNVVSADGPVAPSIPWSDPRDPAAQPTASERRVLTTKQRRYEQLIRAHERWTAAHCRLGTVCSNADSGGGGGNYPYSVALSLQALQQQYCNWCGPATTQEVQYWMNNFAWATSQTDIASYEGTCFPPNSCGTVVYRNRQGLNNYVTPLPANFIYWEYQPTGTGDWWGKLQTDIAGYYMPQVVTVAPHDPDASQWLPSWPTAVYAGHYIVLDAYTGYTYTGGSVHYVDTSGGCMGSTGLYSTTSDVMYAVILKTNTNHPQVWVIW